MKDAHCTDANCTDASIADAPMVPWQDELERLRRALDTAAAAAPAVPDKLIVAPGVHLLPAAWRGLSALAAGGQPSCSGPPEPGEELLVVWPQPDAPGTALCGPASADDLLALKIVAEQMDLRGAARQADAPAGLAWELLRSAREKGLLAGPLPDPQHFLVRDPDIFPRFGAPPAGERRKMPAQAYAADAFTLQWHITQKCDLHCKHCYDRSKRADVSLENGLRVVREMADFCQDRTVAGQVSFIGGNPLLHPHFMDFYSAVQNAGLNAAILGNPCSEGMLDRILSVAEPVYFQISLEGLEIHNDAIRGSGHFQRSLEFLDMLRRRDVRSFVMLTLTNDNQDQVLDLARELEGRADQFTYNRLALMGEGADLVCANKDGFRDFAHAYLDAAQKMGHVRLKDNLLDVALQERGEPLMCGCTGHGCGAAFNFIALLSNGQAHACRKLHSPIGNVFEQGLAAVYDGGPARQWRRGPAGCQGCGLRPVCGGCMAVAAGFGLDPLQDTDPYCWLEQPVR